MAKIDIDLHRKSENRYGLSEYTMDERCLECVLGCTGGCLQCDVMVECDSCRGESCRYCEVKVECLDCRCKACDGCPYEGSV